ncbi:MAG TPA: 4'-phosphopantetheinyl transferase superfamily protein [Bacteroidales bacterium]|nr:4'-phosphopantetheinyl transferase superfamily protein [Bacteroidales bacterium]
MPVVFSQHTNNGSQLVLWHITENVENLLQGLHHETIDAVSKFKCIQRQREYAAVRQCLLFLNLNDGVIYDYSGKPRLETACIGITHSGNYAAIIVNRNVNVSIDIERPQTRIEKMKDRFMSDEECLSFASISMNLSLIWSAKECVYKWFGNRPLDYRRHICIETIGQQNIITRVKNTQLVLNYKVFEEYENLIMIWCEQT